MNDLKGIYTALLTPFTKDGKINEKELHTLISESVKRILKEDENIGLNDNMDMNYTSDDEDWGDYNPMDGSLSDNDDDDDFSSEDDNDDFSSEDNEDFEEDFPEDDYENDFYTEDEDSLIPDTSSTLDRTIQESIKRLKRKMF